MSGTAPAGKVKTGKKDWRGRDRESRRCYYEDGREENCYQWKEVNPFGLCKDRCEKLNFANPDTNCNLQDMTGREYEGEGHDQITCRKIEDFDFADGTSNEKENVRDGEFSCEMLCNRSSEFAPLGKEQGLRTSRRCIANDRVTTCRKALDSSGTDAVKRLATKQMSSVFS